METLLFGDDSQGALTRVLRARGHDISHCRKSADAWSVYVRREPPLIIVERIDGDALDFCRRIRKTRGGDVPIIIAVMARYTVEQLEAILEADVDECIIESYDNPERLNARLAFAEKKARGSKRRNEAEKELHRRLRQHASIAAIGQKALQTLELKDVYAAVVETVAEALDVDYVSLLELDQGRSVLHVAAGVGWNDDSQVLPVPDQRDSLVRYALESVDPIIIQDLKHEERFDSHSFLLAGNSRSGIIVAVHADDRPAGLLAAFSEDQRTFSQDDIHFLQAVANVLSAAVSEAEVRSALRESEARAHAILNTTVDGIITIDTEGIIESFNTAAERLFGYSAEEVTGKNVKVLMPQPYRREHDQYIETYLRTGRRHIIGVGREVVGRRKDGSTFPMYLAVSEVFFDDRRIFTGIVRDITEPRRLEQEILRTSEQERRRIGQDLHDGLGQMLTGIGLITRNLARRMKAEKMETAAEMQEVTELLKEADQYARTLSRNLVPVEVEANGLSASLKRLTQNAERLFGIKCTFEEKTPVLVNDNSVAVHLYRIAQEAVSNAAKHGRSSKVEVTLSSESGDVRLRIMDDGIGFTHKSGGQGMGIRIMHYRARLIGASLDLSSSLAGGTVVTCLLPRHGVPVAQLSS